MSNIEFLKEHCGSSIYIKRDDRIFLPSRHGGEVPGALQKETGRAVSLYGGNKVRIAEELMKDLRAGGYNSLISYGSPSSNMNRAAALIARRERLKCRVIIKREKEAPETENERLIRESGAEIFYCSGEKVRECVESALEKAAESGEKPYYIYGDSSGKGNELTLMRASYKEYAEIAGYEKECGVPFDFIVLTAGTGMTISGLAAAMCEAAADTGLLGISAARDAGKLKKLAEENLELYFKDRSFLKYMPQFRDEYLCGGYGLTDPEIEAVMDGIMKAYGIPLDPVYTGKGFYGMLKEIEGKRLSGRILFIHTGGYPIYLDWARGRQICT